MSYTGRRIEVIRILVVVDGGGQNFEHFLSCGITGILEGIRYKKSPELAKEFETRSPSFTAPARHIVFKRWDRLGEADAPQVAIFFAPLTKSWEAVQRRMGKA